MEIKSTRGLSFSVDRLLQPSPAEQAAKKMSDQSSSGGSSTSSSPPSSPFSSPIVGGVTKAATPAHPIFLAAARTGTPPRHNIMTLNTTFPFPVTFPFAHSGSPGALCAATNWSQPGFTSWSLGQARGAPGLPAKLAPPSAAGWSLHPAQLHKPQHITCSTTKRILELPKVGTPIVSVSDDIEDYTGGDDDSDSSSPGPSSSEHGGADETEPGKIGKKYKKKKRTTFTSSQLQQLETRFNQQKYLTKLDRCRMAQSLGLTEKHIKTWYQNRRTKWKRECTDEMWSRERETAAANMYTQHLQLKSINGSSPLTIS